MASAAASGSAVGGIRTDSFTVVDGRSTLPARLGVGAPPMPTTSSDGSQVRAISSCSVVGRAGRVSPASG